MLIDTHCHLTADGLRERIDEVHANALAAGVQRMILVATDADDAAAALALLARFDNLYLVLGVHPHEAGKCDEDDFELLEQRLGGAQLAGVGRERIVGIGETGLDFYYDFATPAQQERVFRRHLELAVAHDLPIVIHARDAELRVCEILADYPALAGRVVFHCFSGEPDVARRVLDLGDYLSFTGVVTFKKSEEIQASAKLVPADRIMVETDAPYLSPAPMRKIRPNEPALVTHTARFLAELRGERYETFAATTTANAERFFRLPEEQA